MPPSPVQSGFNHKKIGRLSPPFHSMTSGQPIIACFLPVSSRFPDHPVCRPNAIVKMGFGFYRQR
jgi:hypothetical protein